MKPQLAFVGLWEGIAILVPWVLFGTTIGLLAARKNRNGWAWGVIGGFACLVAPSLIALMFMPYLCPKCQHKLSNQEWHKRNCPHCGDIRSSPKPG